MLNYALLKWYTCYNQIFLEPNFDTFEQLVSNLDNPWAPGSPYCHYFQAVKSGYFGPPSSLMTVA